MQLLKKVEKFFFKSAQKRKNFAIIAPYVQTEENLMKKDEDFLKIKQVESVKGFAMFLNLEEFKDIGFLTVIFYLFRRNRFM